MIFISKKQFENALYDRMGEMRFKSDTDMAIMQLKDEVRDLKYRLDALEQIIHQPTPTNIPQTHPSTPIRDFMVNPTYEPAPYWTNPNWKAPDFTCTNTPQTQCKVPQMDILKDVVETNGNS